MLAADGWQVASGWALVLALFVGVGLLGTPRLEEMLEEHRRRRPIRTWVVSYRAWGRTRTFVVQARSAREAGELADRRLMAVPRPAAGVRWLDFPEGEGGEDDGDD